MQWRHPKRPLTIIAAGGRRQPASRHQSCNRHPVDSRRAVTTIDGQTIQKANLFKLSAGPDQARLTVVSTCPATTPARRTVVVRRSPAVFTSAGVSRLRVTLRLDHDDTHMRVRPPGQTADAGALPRWTTGTALAPSRCARHANVARQRRRGTRIDARPTV
jgi:hypothetical protein